MSDSVPAGLPTRHRWSSRRAPSNRTSQSEPPNPARRVLHGPTPEHCTGVLPSPLPTCVHRQRQTPHVADRPAQPHRTPFKNPLRCANLLASDARGDAAYTARITGHDPDLGPAPTYTHATAHTTRTPDQPRAHCSDPATAHTPRTHPARSSFPCPYGSCTFRPLPPRPPLTSSACGSAEPPTNTVPHADCMCSCTGIDACSP